MKEINILDCTLRDGGYVNNWNFSNSDIQGITKNLNKANVEFIELGYLSEVKKSGGTIFSSIEETKKIKIPLEKKIIMINYGEYKIENIPINNDDIFAIRVVFKKDQWKKAIAYSKVLKEKKYNIFLQPMQTCSYKDIELLELIEEVNKILPKAMYIVDSFGEMSKEDLIRLSSLYSNNLNKDIFIGFHSHNNFQLSFALAIEFLKLNIIQKKIVDSSVYGMGRGAGNLNTELFTSYLNKNLNKNYKIDFILKIMDLYIEKIYQKEKWGYNLGHFLSASLGCHPNYATYLLEKVNMGVGIIKIILEKIPDNEKSVFNKELIERLYIEYQKEVSQKIEVKRENEILLNENILILAPGRSIKKSFLRINNFIVKQKNLTTISLNHKNRLIKTEYILFTNEKRYEEYFENFKKTEKVIVSSNIKSNLEIDFVIDYIKYSKNGKENLSSEILFNFVENKKNIKKIYIAGMDGYIKNKKNYAIEVLNSKNFVEINKKIEKKIKESSKKIEFLTKSIFTKKGEK